MTPRSVVLACTLGLLCVIAGGRADAAGKLTRIDRAFQKFWAARTPAETAKAIDEVVASRVTFREALRRLKQGRRYLPHKPGVLRMRNKTPDGVVYQYDVNVPAGYDPRRRYPVRIQLHGDVGAGDQQARGRVEIPPFAPADQFSVTPYAWSEAPWWSEDQIVNLQMILDTLKRTFNVDENRIVVAGESDGGTGAYFIGMCDTTPYASFLPINSFILVLGNEGLTLNERVFPNNLRNKPLFVVNGGQDPLYPTERVDPYIEHMKNNGVRIDYHPQPNAAHDTTWWPEVKPAFDKFIAEHPRNPLPDTITWEVGEGEKCNRAHWLIIDRLSEPPDDAYQASVQSRFTVKRGGANPYPLFAYQAPAGRVDVTRTGNLVRATAEGVAELTLLLSADRLDFRQPVKILVNDTPVFDGIMEPSVRMLLNRAARDNDRTMLFGAELHVRLEP